MAQGGFPSAVRVRTSSSIPGAAPPSISSLSPGAGCLRLNAAHQSRGSRFSVDEYSQPRRKEAGAGDPNARALTRTPARDEATPRRGGCLVAVSDIPGADSRQLAGLPITVVCSASVDTAATSCPGRVARSKLVLPAITRRSATAAAIPGLTTRTCSCVAFGSDAITGLVTSRP